MIEVSVCVISYNFEKYIDKTIESIVKQKTNFEYELIVCDDGSSDSTQDILLEYQKKYPNLIKLVLLQENTKGTMTLVKAVEIAKGKYVSLLEGDDFWCNENKLQMQYDFMEKHPEMSAVVTHLNAVAEDGSPMEMPKNWKKNIQKDVFTIDDFEKQPISPFAQSLFYRNREEYKELLNVKGRLDNYTQAMLLTRGNIGIIHEITATYRIVRHTGNNFSSMSIAQKAQRLFNCGLLINEYFGDRINMQYLMEGYLADSILFGFNSLSDAQKQYFKKLSLKRKIALFFRIIFSSFLGRVKTHLFKM
jgi:glycosyltransferase involved in cell wall biosynthesis